MIARHCAGGLILGFSQVTVDRGRQKVGTADAIPTPKGLRIPTPWNHLEAGILFALQVPLLVFREEGIAGGVFDNGVTDVFVHAMPSTPLAREARAELRSVFLKWQADVRHTYYRSP